LCRRCNYLMDKIQSLGDGQRMGPIRPSQLTMHNSWDLIVTFEGLVFGKQKRKESISFLLGFYFSARFSQQINCWQDGGLVVHPAPFALKNPRQHLTSSYTAHSPDKCGRSWKLGRKILLRFRLRGLTSWSGGRRNWQTYPRRFDDSKQRC